MKKPVLVENLAEFKENEVIDHIVDEYDFILEELFEIRNPWTKFKKEYETEFAEFKKDFLNGSTMEESGNWFFFPWSKTLVHFLDEETHFEIRTARNQNIITKEEQKKLYNSTVSIAGLSVGSHGALTLSMMGMAKNMRIADPDTISATNLNRIRYDYTLLGRSKAEVAAEYIYQMNPYANLEVYDKGVNEENFDAFLDGSDILVEEMDNLFMKIRIREVAKEKKMPVVMATDNANNVILDVERYDLDPDLVIFNGVAGNLTVHEFQEMKPEDMPRLATKIAGVNLIEPRMANSLLEVGKTLYSWPQAGDAATLSGVVLANAIKRIILGEPLIAGKVGVNIDQLLDPTYNNPDVVEARDAVVKDFKNKLGL